MYAILKNIHPSVTIDSLEMWLQPFLEGNFFQRKGELRAIKIIQLKDKSGIPIERHALIRVCSDKTRKRLINALNKHTYTDEQNQKQRVRAAEFVVRHAMNDRRIGHHKDSKITHLNRRAERRRTGLKIVTIAEKNFGNSGFPEVKNLVHSRKNLAQRAHTQVLER